MTTIRPPSLDVPEFEKRGFSEADAHSTLFDPDMIALATRDEVRRFHRTVGTAEAQAAVE